MKNYFTFEELTKTDTGLVNDPITMEQIRNLDKLRFVLNILRHLLGCPIIVNSAFRTSEVNEAVGGVPGSYHLEGLAADIRCSDNRKLSSICNHWFDCGIFSECIVYDNFIHVAI